MKRVEASDSSYSNTATRFIVAILFRYFLPTKFKLNSTAALVAWLASVFSRMAYEILMTTVKDTSANPR
jgi:hypothetical protein